LILVLDCSLCSLSTGAFTAPVFVEDITLFFGMPFLFVSTLIPWLFFIRGGKLDKLEASMLIGFCFVFIWLKFFVL